MATYKITMPDGAAYKVTAGDHIDPETLKAHVASEHAKTIPHLTGLSAAAAGGEKMFDNLAAGAMHIPGVGAIDRLGQRMGMPSVAQANAHSAELQANASPGMRTAGEVAGSLIIPSGRGFAGMAAGNALSGALLSDKKNATGIVGDAAKSAVTGTILQGGMRGIGKVVAPTVSKAVAELRQHNIPVTIGQALGGAAKSLEDKAMSLPVVGGMIRGARDQGTLAFNRAVINNALSPINDALPKGMQAGHEAIAYAGDKLSAGYDAIVPHLSATLDRPLVDGMNHIKKAASTLPDSMKNQFSGIIDAAMKNRATGGIMKGEAIKDAQSALRHEAGLYSKSQNPDQQKLGHMLTEAASEFNDWVARHNPAAAPQLKALNNGWSQLVKIERAGAHAGNTTGVFTPKAYAAAIKATNNSVRKRAVARGEAQGQILSDAAANVLPSVTPDSGTPGRAGVMALLSGGTAAAHFLHPAVGLPMVAAAGAYSGVGQRGVNALVDRGVNPSAGSVAIRNALNKSAPIAGRLGAAYVAGR
jgi:hypothetical protein